MYTYQATVVKVVDGDTVDLDVDLGFSIHRKERFRLSDINAPEVSTTAGLEAKAYMIGRLPIGTVVTITTKKDRADNYGRFLANIFLGDVNLNQEMLSTGHAVKYP